MLPTRLIGACAALSLSTFALAAPQLPQDALPPGWDGALARYKQVIARKAFREHTEGRDRIAQTRNPEALPILSGDYVKPQDYPEYSKYTIATLLGRHFDRLPDVSPLAALRRSSTKPIDTWLWVQTLRIEIDKTDANEALSVVRDGKVQWQRAAAIAAIGNARSADLEAAVLPVVLDFPKKEADRNLLIGAMTGAFWENKKRVNEAGYRKALEAYVSLLAPEVGLGHTIKVQMARHLQGILDTPAMWVNPEAWLEVLQRGEVKQRPDNGTSAEMSFFGITTDGERFCYVLDMSDSMLKPIEPSARPSTTPETGPRKKKKKRMLDESDLDWTKIKTRWDLAREQMRISLSRLTPDKHFAVVWFGSGSGTLDATKGMVKATQANVDRVLKELDAIKAIPKEQIQAPDNPADFPDGKLRGDTNMHAGLKLAFALAGKDAVKEPAYVDPDALVDGCDTIFLVSDGRPSTDDFRVLDKDYGEGQVVSNHETKNAAQRTPELWYHGPYDQDDWLIEDFTRMNAFRRIRLYAVGIGEANMRLLERLAELGHGEAFSFGKKQADGGGK